MISPWERYLNDPLFRKLTEAMLHYIIKGDFTPTEVREAALLACVKFEELKPRLMPDNLLSSQEIEVWLDGRYGNKNCNRITNTPCSNSNTPQDEDKCRMCGIQFPEWS